MSVAGRIKPHKLRVKITMTNNYDYRRLEDFNSLEDAVEYIFNEIDGTDYNTNELVISKYHEGSDGSCSDGSYDRYDYKLEIYNDYRE